ncbi:MAG: hypothetical protein IT464_12770 [Planctomycetes bacterium]|nr:hypothetical protein [Planctomycetota bacterium]
MTTHLLKYRSSGQQDEMPRLLSEAHRQGEVMFLLTTTGKVQKATDSTTNLKMAGLNVGQDRVANASATGKAASVLLDVGGCDVLLDLALTIAGTGGTVALSGSTAGSIDSITADGVEILGTPVAYGTSLDATAIVAIAQINANNGRFYAYRSASATIKIIERVATVESFAVVSTVTTMSSTDTNASAGKNTIAANEGADAYVSSATKAKFAGTGKMGVFQSFLDQNGTRFAAQAGSGTLTITGTTGSLTSITAGGTELLGNTIAYSTSAAVTAALVAADINLLINTHKYFAVAIDDTVHIYQTTDSIDEAEVALVPTGALTTRVTPIRGGRQAKAWVRLRQRGAVLT